jgi:gamma-glutamyltranspeptidase/glutathione hydrolase
MITSMKNKRSRRILSWLVITFLIATSITTPAPQHLSIPTELTAAAAASQPVRAKHGMVASTSQIASQVGVDVMKRGGNAIDAGIAVALALAVTYPAAGNLGGGGFMMIRLRDGKTTAIDYREMAPAAAHRNI